jgi:hypothetical protein
VFHGVGAVRLLFENMALVDPSSLGYFYQDPTSSGSLQQKDHHKEKQCYGIKDIFDPRHNRTCHNSVDNDASGILDHRSEYVENIIPQVIHISQRSLHIRGLVFDLGYFQYHCALNCQEANHQSNLKSDVAGVFEVRANRKKDI